MVQHSNEHLTITQLSAYQDKELASSELALCDAHLQTCPQCQAALADLRLTSALLRGMPQVEVPRSFALPLNMAVLPATPDRETPGRPQPSRSQRALKRSLRVLSTLAAIVGLLFILVGALSSLPHGGGASSTASLQTQTNGSARPASTTPPLLGTHNAATPSSRATQQVTSAEATGQAHKQQTPVVTPTAAAIHNPNLNPPTEPQFSLPPVLDPGQPEGLLSIGATLLVLGILGILLTRRRKREAELRGR